jgi:hypothetical protein
MYVLASSWEEFTGLMLERIENQPARLINDVHLHMI